MYGAQLIEAMRRRDPSLQFFGVGGDRMRAAGCDTVVEAKDLAVVGITEILSHLPKIWGLFHRLIAEADTRRPDLVVVIDSPAFNWRVARQMRKRSIPVVYYVCPQFWAWRQGRVKLLRKYVDKALVIFPFEEKFYRDRGVNAAFVGHPLADLPRPQISRGDYAQKHDLILPNHGLHDARKPAQRSPHEFARHTCICRQAGIWPRISPACGTDVGSGLDAATASKPEYPPGSGNPSCARPLQGRDNRQRNGHRGGCPYGTSLRNGLSGLAAHLFLG